MIRVTAAISAALIWTALSVLPASAADKVVLMLNWYVYGGLAPFYYGKAKRIYSAKNIDLEIQEGRGSAATTQAVGAKTANFGYVDVPTMMRAAIKGAPVIAPGVLLQTSPMSVMGFVEKNIRKPEDIKGKTVAITPADSMTQIWPLFLKKTGLKESDFQTVAGDGQTKLNAVINGQADLLLGYVMDQSMKIKDATGKDVYPIKFADYGINMVSSGIVANTDYVKANADLVRRFMSATTKAVEAAEKEPKAAAQSILAMTPHDIAYKRTTLNEPGSENIRRRSARRTSAPGVGPCRCRNARHKTFRRVENLPLARRRRAVAAAAGFSYQRG